MSDKKENLKALMESAKEDYPDGNYPDYILTRRPWENDNKYFNRLRFLGFTEVKDE